ncbi:MAG TPA: CotH kinase family protein, partial [Methylomirabilota bacterium]|nr:CotH kinase family protein [Methylomirabilota bacterium]
FSPAPGVYTSNTIAVLLASSVSSAQIRYTLDGSTPSATSPLYTAPITLATNAVVRARAFEPGKVDSEITAANYVLLDSSLTNFSSNLPLVIIDTSGAPIVADSRTPSYLVFIDTNGPGGRASFTSPPDFRGRAGVELHGQSSLGFPKNSMNVEINSEKDNDKRVPLLGLPEGSDWVLYAPYTDKTFMNDFLTYELHEAMGHYAVRRKYVEVFVRTAPGKLSTNDYRGIYVLLEKIRIHPDRVDITELDENDNSEPNITGGYIWKKDKDSPGDVNFTTSSGQLLKHHDPKGSDLTAQQRAWLSNHLNQFEAVLHGPNWRDPRFGYLNYIDPDSFVDQHWIVEFPKNIDGYRLSNYMNKDRGGKIQMEPIWDWNLSWGNANYLEGGYTNGWYHTLLGGDADIWLNRLRTDPDFYQRIIDRWGELRTNLFALPNLMARIDRITNQLHEAQLRDFAKWPRLGAYVWPNPDGALNTGGTPLPTRNWDVNYVAPTAYAGIIQQMKNWVTGRHRWVESQFLIGPTLSLPSGFISPGAAVAINGSLGSVYYTLDGSDPRAPGGAISPSAILYNSAITLTNNTGVFARSLHTNRWSSPAQSVYVITTPSLRISEIMYHPADPGTNSPYAEDDFEFIEVKNTGVSTINLAGARLAGGIDYTFAATALVPAGLATLNNFDGGGTAFTAATLNNGPAPTITGGGPNGSFLRLLSGGTMNLMRNRVAFAQTATGGYGRVTADFDFRATTVGPAVISGLPTLQDFDGTAGNTAFAIGGSAAALPVEPGTTGGFLRLVPATGSLSGFAGFDRTASGTTWNTVIATFDFRITPPSEANQADGMGFALLNTANYGTTGAGPGGADEPNLTASIGLGIDVYNNAAPNDLNNNHLSLHYGGLIGTATPPFDLSNGRFHRAQVIVRFSGGRALVTVRLTPDVNNVVNPVPVTLFQDAVINGANPYEMRAAFGARTGGQVAHHDIDNVNVQFLNETDTTAGLSMVLLSSATFGASGAGTALAHFTDAPTLTNTLALDVAFHPSNYLNDAALYWNGALAANRFVPPGSFDLDNGVFHHAHVTLDTFAGGAYATVVLTPNIIGTSGTPIVLASNLFIAGLTPQNWRVEFAGRNGMINTSLDLENVSVNYFSFASLLLAPGESILVVKNRAAFEARYGTGFRIAGEFTGRLDNAGDHIVLLGPVGEPILDFSYSDDWFRLTDGLGFSLVADSNAAATNYGSSSTWHNSTYQGGSPGAGDPVVSIAPVVVNEILANSVLPEVDRIELFNPTTNIVNMGGWYLSDDFNSPKKFRIPNGTSIGAGGFLVLTEAEFNPTPGLGTSFALGSDGDEVWLFSGDGTTNLTGYVHGFDFGGAEENVSFGRYVDAAGGEDFPPQIARTFGAANAGPRVGPVVVSEVMYHPPDVNGLDDQENEFIELANITGAPVALFSAALPTDTWRLRDAVDFDFPLNTTLAAHERVLVVGFDPATNAAALAAFRAQFNVVPAVRIFGPYSGKLDNSADDIHLNRPLAPGTNGTIYVRADKVSYEDSAPWAAAGDGYGATLQRRSVVVYGNEPTNWVAAVGTAGADFPAGGVPPAITSHPAGASLLGGQSVSLSVTATGPGLRYQWRANGTNIFGATGSTLVLSNIQVTQAGDYHVAVFNASEGVVSSNAPVTVIAPVMFTLQPTNQNVLPGTNVTLVAAAVGFAPVTYQWRLNGTNILNATNATYSFTGASLATHGLYQVTASDGYSSTDSSDAFIFVLIRPGFVQQPLAQTVLQGQNATFSVVVTGAPPIWFRWIRGGSPYITSSVPVLTLTNVQANVSIRVAATNVATGPGGINSSTVQLTVLPDFDGDGIADSWETNYFGFSTNNTADGALDFDGDGMINRDEYVAGTNPTNALSVLKLVLTATNSAVLEFVAQPNISYTVQFRTNLTSATWSNLTSVTAATLVRTVEVNVPKPPLEPARFYRIVTPLVP